jgi:hypothetical protein
MRHALVVLTACGGGFSTAPTYYFDNAMHVATDDATAQRYEGEVVREAAASALACDKHALTIEQPYTRAYVVTGCRHRAVFVAIDRLEPSAWRVRAVDVSLATPQPGEVPPERYGVDVAAEWRAIVGRASADLGCDRDQITPDLVPQGRAREMPIGEGCGRRASYVTDEHALRLIAIVPL